MSLTFIKINKLKKLYLQESLEKFSPQSLLNDQSMEISVAQEHLGLTLDEKLLFIN